MDFEAKRRRIAVLSAHFCPSPINSHNTHIVSTSNCSSNTSNLDCVFCQIIQGNSPAFKLYEDDMCICILDTNPLSRGHSLIIPKRHCCSLDATPPSVIAAMCSKVPFISNAIMKATGSDSFNLLVNNGAAAGQVIFHTHIHIIPRKENDCLWASESLKRLSLKLDQALHLVESIQEQILVANRMEGSKNDGSDLSGISRD
ncbi:adenylylsulfatase HINT3-like isoform X1 [Amaranthus tricolor]|uniref:adenylylsulfatase HINT3-like isoform X1 n=1 Tax=Amaranthus tricolor TaxID=29722 RepID=UPI00258B1D87|nr:adenylylsulfatase HINT3-like isoform X1 [Amaranthus tricolor]